MNDRPGSGQNGATDRAPFLSAAKTTMTDADFPEELIRLIQGSIPTVDALHLLVPISQQPDRLWKPDELVKALQPVPMTVSAIAEYLALFQTQRLVIEPQVGQYQYRPGSPDLEAAVCSLIKAYNQRPVTLIRLVYALRGYPISLFADRFSITQKD